MPRATELIRALEPLCERQLVSTDYQEPYNPLAKSNLGESVADALLRSPVLPLSESVNVVGAGVYVIYYVGSFELYRAISIENGEGRFARPIYVGKAVPSGGRKGGVDLDSGVGPALRNRLRQHASTITESENLELSDFYFRALTVDDIWIPLGENVLISKYVPLWNRVLDGFGIKTPGKGRRNQRRSMWDTLHPGRRFVTTLSLAESEWSVDAIRERVRAFIEGRLQPEELLQSREEHAGYDSDT